MTGARAAFIDRDGTINELVVAADSGRPESPLRAADVALIPGSAAAVRRLADAGWLVIGVSNQPAAAKATASCEQLAEVQARVLELLALEDARFDDFRICPHHPDGMVAELARVCPCRKPRPGMLLDAAAQLGVDLSGSWMIGDTDSDVLAGRAAGCRTVLIAHAPSAHKRTDSVHADSVVSDLNGAVTILLRAKQ